MAWTAQNHQQQFQMLHQQLDAPDDLSAPFHLIPLIEDITDAMERGVGDQQLDALVNGLISQFKKCEQVLNSMSSSSAKTVQAEKQKLDDHEKQLEVRRELLSKFKGMVEAAIGSAA